ncbi:MAG: hypothetical protein ACXVW6_13765 [Nocardioidaceae bacterium]
MTASPRLDARDGAPDKVLAARVATTGAALFWGVLFFGVIDLLVVPLQDERFDEHYLLETGWGLLYTVLVMVPLLLWAVRPRWRVFPQQVLVVAGAVLLTAVVTPAMGQVLVAFGLLVSVTPSVWAARRRWPAHGLSVRGTDPWLVALVVLSAAGAATYAVRMVAAAHAGSLDEETWGLMHLPMQAAFGLALAGSAATAVLNGGASCAPGWKVATLPASLSAVWFGSVSVLYPEHLGSVGRPGGVAAIVWGLAFAALAFSHRATSRGRGR